MAQKVFWDRHECNRGPRWERITVVTVHKMQSRPKPSEALLGIVKWGSNDYPAGGKSSLKSH